MRCIWQRIAQRNYYPVPVEFSTCLPENRTTALVADLKGTAGRPIVGTACLSAIGVTRFFMSLNVPSLNGSHWLARGHPRIRIIRGHLGAAWTNRDGEMKIPPRGKLAVTQNRPLNDQTLNAGLRRLRPTSGRAG